MKLVYTVILAIVYVAIAQLLALVFNTTIEGVAVPFLLGACAALTVEVFSKGSR